MPDFHEPADPIRRFVCTVPDNVNQWTPRWGKRELTWCVEHVIPALGRKRQEELTAASFEDWAQTCDLRFAKESAPLDADIRLTTGRGSRQSLDGAGGTLAYAWLPGSADWRGPSSQVYDLDERWVAELDQQGGIVYRPVNCHESGHTLGLSHGPRGSLMQATYDPRLFSPQRDEIDKMVALYGPPSKTRTPSGPTTRELFEQWYGSIRETERIARELARVIGVDRG